MEEQGFSHITVLPDDEEELVIQAGSYAPSAESAAPSISDAFSGEDALLAAEAEQAAAVEAGLDAFEDAAETRTEPEAEAEPQVKAGQTTMADLEVEPMSMMQKVIIAAALIFLLAAAVYYFCFIR